MRTCINTSPAFSYFIDSTLPSVFKNPDGIDIFFITFSNISFGSSDSLDKRPEMTRILDYISNYSKFLIVAIDRLSRNELHSAMITHTFAENNVQIVTPTKEYNFNIENNILMNDFEKLIARPEFRLIKKRLRQGKIKF